MKILFVEDNPGDAVLMKEVFRKLDLPHELQIADDGSEIFSLLKELAARGKEALPNLILLDLNMPKKGGIEILAELKQHPDFCVIPVIILTSSQSPRDVEESYRSSANCVLTKPMDLKGLIEMVKALHVFWFEMAVLPRQKTEVI